MIKENVPNLIRELTELEQKYGVTLINEQLYQSLKAQLDRKKFDVSGITVPMKMYIADLESNTGIKFTGTTVSDAMCYIDTVKNCITLKQKEYINKICSTLGVECKAQTKDEASSFIRKYRYAYNIVTSIIG